MTQALLFGSGSGTKTSYKGRGINTNPPTSSRGSVEAMNTRLLIRKLLSCPGVEKDARREAVTRFLLNVRKPDVCIDELLFTCTTQGGPDGLDTAIDILSGTGDLVLKYFWDYLQRDIANWNPKTERAYKPNDDYWYVLLRAVARTEAEEMEKLPYIMCCASAESRGIREGVVEALRDLRTSFAKERLRDFAANDSNHSIRQAAQEALDDLES